MSVVRPALRSLLPLIVAGCLALAAASGCRSQRTLPRSPVAPSAEDLSAEAGDGPLGLSPATQEPAAPDGGFYPLSLGNRWTSRQTFTITVEILSGTPDVQVETHEGTVEREIVRTEIIEGVEYLVERSSLQVDDRPSVKDSWKRFRQDRSGLYVADVSMNRPPPDVRLTSSAPPAPDDDLASHAIRAFLTAGERPKSPAVRLAMEEHVRRLENIGLLLEPGRAGSGAPDPDVRGPEPGAGPPGEIFPGELRALDYPLHTGGAWFTRREPFNVRSEVEAHEVLSLPAGRLPCFRVRVDNETLEPEDRVVAWYGRCGYVAAYVHAETLAMDVETGEVARITTDDTTLLADVFLAEPGQCERPPRD